MTVLTGYLGAGKTTLLNHLLTQPHGHKCAIIINEFGAVSIDNQLVVGADEEILELNNGCLCCRVRGDLIRSLNDLINRKKRFDYVIIETTGLADPSPVAHTFMASELTEHLRLDGIVTVVDARNLEKEMNDGPEPLAQIAFADVILLNKTDLVSPAELARIESRIRAMNKLAVIHRTQQSRIDVGKILDVKARELNAPLPPAHEEHEHDHDHDHVCDDHCDHDHDHDHEHGHKHEGKDEHEHGGHHHHHDESVKSFYIEEERALDLPKLEAWLSELLKSLGANIYRSKGVLNIKGHPKRVVFQGVQMLFDSAPDRFWNAGEKRRSQLVFIGKDLDEEKLRADFEQCIAG